MTFSIEHARLISARLAFRSRWVRDQAPKRKQVKPHHIEWELEHDEESNFARMGAQFVDPWFGILIKPHPRRLKRHSNGTIREITTSPQMEDAQ